MTEEIIIDGIDVAECEHFKINRGFNCYKGYNCTDKECSDCYYKLLKQAENTVNECHKYLAELEDKVTYLEQENESLKKEVKQIGSAFIKKGDYARVLEQENKELSFAVEKCLENAGIECDDEEQALRSLPMLGNAHYKVLVEKEELEQENRELRKANEISIEKITVTAEAKRLQELEQENKELKEEIQFHNKENSNLLAERNAAQIGYDEIREVREHYRSALEEIRKIVTSAFAKQRPYKEDFAEIENIINKVLNKG